jgi:ABC-type sugar transport system ATPase subunit
MGNVEFLQMREISKSYDGTQALRRVDFSATQGEVHAIVGENGAGKSTLVKILAGVILPSAGEILLDDQAVTLRSPIRAFRVGIRAVHQEFSLVPHLSVTENILMGQMSSGRFSWIVDWPKSHARAESILQEIGFTGIDVRKRVSRLSVSHQQMVEIAKAAAVQPRILILDEPSAVLSQEELKRLFALIRKMKKAGTLILYISHRLDEVFEIADRITVLKDGELVGTVAAHKTEHGQLIKMMVGRTLEEIYPRRDAPTGTEVFSVRGLTQSGVFSDISFRLTRGEIVGMAGLVGSGRTNVARCIFGAEPFTSGEVRLEGKIVHLRSPRDAVAAGIALLTEDRKRDGLVMNCSIRDNASLSTMGQVSRLGVLKWDLRETQVSAIVKELSVHPPLLGRLVRELSGGNQQKVVLAKWLLSRARVLLLDEPTRGVDIATKVEIYHLINNLAKKGVAILLISSELPEILGMSDRILVMREGRLVKEFSKAEASEEGVLAAAAGVNP